MTPKEKNQLLELRRNGWSIKRLAEFIHKSIPMTKKILYSVRPGEIYCIVVANLQREGMLQANFAQRNAKGSITKSILLI